MAAIINLKELAEKSEIDYFKLRNNLNGKYNSFDVNDRTEVANALLKEANLVFNQLGFDIKMDRLEDLD